MQNVFIINGQRSLELAEKPTDYLLSSRGELANCWIEEIWFVCIVSHSAFHFAFVATESLHKNLMFGGSCGRREGIMSRSVDAWYHIITSFALVWSPIMTDTLTTKFSPPYQHRVVPYNSHTFHCCSYCPNTQGIFACNLSVRQDGILVGQGYSPAFRFRRKRQTIR